MSNSNNVNNNKIFKYLSMESVFVNCNCVRPRAFYILLINKPVYKYLSLKPKNINKIKKIGFVYAYENICFLNYMHDYMGQYQSFCSRDRFPHMSDVPLLDTWPDPSRVANRILEHSFKHNFRMVRDYRSKALCQLS